MNPRLIHEPVRGTPIDIGGRIFVPEARVTTFVAREATLRTAGAGVAGIRLTIVRPTALIERTPRGERRHRIADAASRQLLAFAVAAAAIPLILNALADRLGAAR